MKAIFIEKSQFEEIKLKDAEFDDDFLRLICEFKILESNVIYFSAGDTKIKELLIKKEPSYSL